MQTDPFKTRPKFLSHLPRLARLFIYHSALGFVISAVFTTIVLGMNLANIGHLVFAVEGGWIAGFVFFVLNGIVFSGVQTAIAVMSLGDDDDQGGGGHRRRVPLARQSQAIPIPVERDRPHQARPSGR